MQSADPAHLFQSDYSLTVGAHRAEKAARTSSGAQYGSPIWLGHKHSDVEKLASGGAGADGGPAKILDLIVRGGEAWTAESGGVVRRTDLETGKTLQLFRGHKAPVSSLAFYTIPSSSSPASARTLLFSGSWDKSIRVWSVFDSSAQQDVPSRPQALLSIPNAGADFLKCLHVLDTPETQILLSGGSDRTVRAWDLSALGRWAAELQVNNAAAPLPEMLGTMREHTRPVNVITSLPPVPTSVTSASSSSAASDPAAPTIFSADSMGRVFEMSLRISRPAEGAASVRFEINRELRGNETGVYALKVGWKREEDEDADDDAEGNQSHKWWPEMWTASADKTARLFPLSEDAMQRSSAPTKSSQPPSGRSSKTGPTLGREPPLFPSITITQPYYVKSILPLSHLASNSHNQQMPSASAQTFPNIILTGSTDERIRVWDLDTTSEAEAEGEEDNRAGDLTRASKNKKEQGPRLIGELEGHWHEVGALAAWRRTRNGPLPEGEGDGGDEKGEWKVGEAADAAPGKSQMAEEGRGEWWIVSASLDGSIRRWKLADALRPRPVLPSNTASIASQPASHAPSTNGTTASCRTSNGKDASSTQSTSKPKMDANANTMTEEEERELAELMGDDDEDEDMED